MVSLVIDYLRVSLRLTSENQNRIKSLDDFILLIQKKREKREINGKLSLLRKCI